MPAFHQAIGPDMLEESAQKLAGVERRRTEAGPAPCTGGARNRAGLAADAAARGEGAPEALRGKGGAGGVAVRMGLTVDVPGEGPPVGGDGLPQAGVAPLGFADGTGEGGEGFDGAKDVGSGGLPGRAGRCEAPTGPKGRDGRVGLQVPAPRMQDPRETREGCPDEPLGFGEPVAGES
jgi:hypothetical protein